jgi:NAD(P)H-hydrate epimerase
VKKIVTVEEMRALEANADYFGVSYGELMENAGRKAAESIIARYKPCMALVVCGTGNNGGDGFVVARLLAQAGYSMLVLLLGSSSDVKPGPAAANMDIVQGMGISIMEIEDPARLSPELFDSCDVIVDAILGTGARGEPREPARTAIRLINDSHAHKVSIDIPSGLDAWTGECYDCVHADLVVTFHAPKNGLERFNVEVADIGIPAKAVTYVGPGDLRNICTRGDVSHKGHSGGRVLVIGGGPYTGAPAFAAMAAYRSGADLVSVAAPQRAADIIASFAPDLIVWPLSDRNILVEKDVDLLVPLIEKYEVVVIGMGLGRAPETMRAVAKILPLCKKVVIDADALQPDMPLHGIITPHHNEFKRLNLGVALPGEINAKADIIKKYSSEKKLVTIVKGPIDVISDGERVKLNGTGNPAMTVGGTGDVLAGIVGAFYCKNNAFEAACSATFLSGASGDLAREDKGYGLIASDVMNMIPYAMKKYRE